MNTVCHVSTAARKVVARFLSTMITVALIFIICGSAMNLSAVYVNDGRMPVALAPQYETAPSNKHSVANEDTKLPLLIDWINIPAWKDPSAFTRWIARNMNYPLTPAVASIGDMFIWSALILIHILVVITTLVYVPLKIVKLYCIPTRQ